MHEVLRYFLMFVELMTCVLLVGVILLQKSKGQGMGMAFGAGVGEALFGAQTGNVLTKTTVVLATIFILNTTVLSLMGASHRSGSRSIADRIPVTKPVSSQPLPSGSTGTEAPVSGMPAGQLPAPMAAPESKSTVDQPAQPLPPAAAQPAKNEAAPATPAPATTVPGPGK